MNVLITEGESLLGQTVAEFFRQQGWNARVVATIPPGAGDEWEHVNLLDMEAILPLLEGCKVLVHLLGNYHDVSADEEEKETRYFDELTAGTFALLEGARRSKVEHVVVVSHLDVFDGYPERYQISEAWAPLPKLQTLPLAHYLGEEICRHFARTTGIDTVLLRVGEVVLAEEVTGQRPNPLWIDARDVAAAIWAACTNPRHRYEAGGEYGTNPWRIYHLSVPQENERFSHRKARNLSLQFIPQRRFGLKPPEEEQQQ